MEFTNDIRFNKKPKASKLLKITYSGTLYKNNSQEVSIVYGFGENWEKTTEQKMMKNARGFSYNILMENYNTFNFCFKNENNEWDNNNSFNYITPIEVPAITAPVVSASSQEANLVVSENIDNLVNTFDINLENAESEKTVTTTNDASLLDALIQELFEEYSNQANSENIQNTVNTGETEIQDKSVNTELQNNTVSVEVDEAQDNVVNAELAEVQDNSIIDSDSAIDSDLDKYFENTEETETKSKVESFKELSIIFDKLIEETNFNAQIQKQTQIKNQNQTINIGQELNQIFDEIFDEKFQPSNNTEETYIPQPDNSDASIEEASTKPVEENNIVSAVSSNDEKQNFFDFENLDFDFNISHNISTQNYASNNFSDSFYDDEDLATHDLNYEFQEILDNVMDNLSKETEPSVIEANNEDYKAQSEAFDKAVSEYADYFDNLIEEIVMSPVTALSSSVSNEQVFENEQNDLAVVQNESTAIASASITETSADGISNEYALYDYKNHSFIYMITRRFKLILNSLFTKIPKLFNKETDTNNN